MNIKNYGIWVATDAREQHVILSIWKVVFWDKMTHFHMMLVLSYSCCIRPVSGWHCVTDPGVNCQKSCSFQFLHSVTLHKKNLQQSNGYHLRDVKRQTSEWVCRLRVFSRPFLFDQEAQAFIPDHKAISLRGENIFHATVNQRGGRIMYLCWHRWQSSIIHTQAL